MKLSILLQGRNDNYCGNFIQRLQLALNQHISNILISNTLNDVEIVISDWGSNNLLSNLLNYPIEIAENIRFIYTPPEITKKYEKDSPYSMPHAVNVGLRRCKGEYILFSDSDGFLPYDTYIFLMQLIDNKYDKVLFCERRDIPIDFYENNSLDELNNLLYSIEIKHSPLFNPDGKTFRGTAIGYFAKKEIFFQLRGFDEHMIYWGYFDIEFYKRVKRFFTPNFLLNYNKKMYHLEHYKLKDDRLTNNNRKFNPQIDSERKTNNNEFWGLANEQVYESCVIKKGDYEIPFASPYIEYQKALSLFNDNKYDEAILILRNLVSLHPLYFDALILIAKILIHDKDYNAAEKLLIFITKYDKSNPEVNFLLEAIKKIEN